MATGRPAWLRQAPVTGPPEWRHGWTTRHGPDFTTDVDSAEHAAAVLCLVQALGLRGGAWARQVHGDVVLCAEQPGCQGEADALWTRQPGLGVVGRGADCPLILVGGRDSTGQGLWGMAHASWRSTVAGITTRLLQEMLGAGLQADTVHGLICPSAGPCCYEVGPEVRAAALQRLGPAAVAFLTGPTPRPFLDLWQANGAQWTAAGLPAGSLHPVGICTICGDPEYPSHRRERGQAVRLAAVSGGLASATSIQAG